MRSSSYLAKNYQKGILSRNYPNAFPSASMAAQLGVPSFQVTRYSYRFQMAGFSASKLPSIRLDSQFIPMAAQVGCPSLQVTKLEPVCMQVAARIAQLGTRKLMFLALWKTHFPEVSRNIEFDSHLAAKLRQVEANFYASRSKHSIGAKSCLGDEQPAPRGVRWIEASEPLHSCPKSRCDAINLDELFS